MQFRSNNYVDNSKNHRENQIVRDLEILTIRPISLNNNCSDLSNLNEQRRAIKNVQMI